MRTIQFLTSLDIYIYKSERENRLEIVKMGGSTSFPIVKIPKERVVIVTGSNTGKYKFV